MLKRVGCLFIILLALAGCSKTFDDEEDIKHFRGLTEKELFDDATEKLNKKDYAAAITRYEAMARI